MVKELKGYLKTDLEETSASYVRQGLIGWEDIKSFPAISVFPIGIKTKKYGEGVQGNIMRFGLGLYVTKGSSSIEDQLDDLYEELLDLGFDTIGNYIEALEITELVYDAYNDKNKGTAYVSLEITFN